MRHPFPLPADCTEYRPCLATLAQALALVEETDERQWDADLHRLRADMLVMQGDDAEAEVSLHKALKVARSQSAKSWELRAATSLARLRQAQGRIDEAREELSSILAWFTEGFDTPDLVEARALLEELSQSSVAGTRRAVSASPSPAVCALRTLF